jgi:hypothetical protein
MAADVKIDIAAEFTGKKAFKQADTATQKLTSNVKKLAGAVGLAYGTSAIIAYGKASVKAFAADEAAARRLTTAVENLGIGFANPQIADYIANLEKSATVTEDLGKGYVGITRGLIKYNTGLTRAELTSKSFNEILGVILKRSAGAAEDYLDTTAYKFDVLSVATSNAAEIIGGGLVDAFALVGGGTDASDAAYVIESIATALANVSRQAGRTVGVIPTLIQNLKNLPRNIFSGFAGAQIGRNVVIPQKKEEVKLTLTQKKQEELMAKLEKDAIKREKERLALLNKQNTAKKLQGVIDKANLALNKGEEVFDMDKIQIAAALTNQAEQLGRATSSAQKLQIANDVARLNVKKSIIELEDAIASKDEQAIIKATEKLNKDLQILSTLSGQSVKLSDIKSILDSLKPKDLINQANLDAALAKIAEMIRLLAQAGLAANAPIPRSGSLGSGIPEGDYIAPVSMTDALAASTESLIELSEAVQERADAFSMLLDLDTEEKIKALAESSLAMTTGTQLFNIEDVARRSLLQGLSGGAGVSGAASGSRYAAQAAAQYNLTVNTGVGDPNAIAEAIDQLLREANSRGTLTNGVLGIA